MESRKSLHYQGKHSALVLGDHDGGDDAIDDKDIKRNSKDNSLFVERRDTGEFVVKMKEDLVESNQDNDEDLPLGAHIFQMESYKKTKNGMFKCLNSKVSGHCQI